MKSAASIFTFVIGLMTWTPAYAQDEPVLFRGNVKSIEAREFSLILDVKKFSSLTEFYIREDGKLNAMYEYLSGNEQPRPEFRDNPEEHANTEIFTAVVISTFNEKAQLVHDYRNERSVGKDKMLKYYKDANGNDTLVETYSLLGKIWTELRQKFNEQNRMISWHETDIIKEITLSMGTVAYENHANGSIAKLNKDSVSWEKAVQPFSRVYDLKGRMTEEYHLDANKQKVYHFKASYGAEYPTMATVFKDNGSSIIYHFNTSGKMTKMTVMNKTGEQEFVRSSVYNEHGDIITRSLVQTRGNITVNWQFNYKYDLQGNWIIVEEKENGKTYRLVERVISYY